ncbi:MAG: hypothetical protein AVDCRST_MAG54-4236, partial [uncultured Actinomycetospora sp.]
VRPGPGLGRPPSCPGRVHPEPAQAGPALAAAALGPEQHLQPLPQPDRAGTPRALGARPARDRRGARHLGREPAAAGRPGARAGREVPGRGRRVVHRTGDPRRFPSHRRPEGGADLRVPQLHRRPARGEGRPM